MGGIFNILAVPLGYVMRWLYLAIQSYGWTIIVATLLVRVVMFPLSLKQQKSGARQAAYQPMIQEIQKKWANDRTRQSQEMQKFYQENNIKMSAGCAPALVNMVVLLGVIAVIQSPLNYIVQLSETDINTGIAIVQQYDAESAIDNPGYRQQSLLIDAIKGDPDRFTAAVEVPHVDDKVYVMKPDETFNNGQILDKNGKVTQETAVLKPVSITAEQVKDVQDFKFEFLGLNLADAPSLGDWTTLIFPILSVITMLLSSFVTMLTSPTTQGRTQMLTMTVVMAAMFGFFAFTVPAGFSLYYTASNIVATIQQFVVRRIHNPEIIKAEALAEIEERRAAKKAKKKVILTAADGDEVVEREVTESELVRLKLAKARELDAKKYGFGAGAEKNGEVKVDSSDIDAEGGNAAEDAGFDKDAGEKPEAAGTDDDGVKDGSGAAGNGDAGYKPGRRKRASQNKGKETPPSDDASSFVQAERAREQRLDGKEEV